MDMDPVVSQVVAYTLYIIISSSIIIFNTPTILMIYVHKSLRKQKELLVVGFMCIADTLHAIAFLVSGAIRLWKTDNGLAEIPITNHDCIKWGFSIIFLFSYQLMGAANLAVSFDRVMAVLTPIKYRALQQNYAYWVIAGVFSYVLCTSSIFMYIVHTEPPLPSSPMCFTSESYTPGIWKYLLFFRMSTLVASSFLYLPIMYRIVLCAAEVRDQKYSKKMLRTTRTIGLTMLAECVFVVIPDIFLNFNPFGLSRYQVIWYIMGVSKGAVNVALITLRHDEIVKVLKDTFLPSSRNSRTVTVHQTQTGITSEKSIGGRNRQTAIRILSDI